jgi:tRNA dimethylallyltransferase
MPNGICLPDFTCYLRPSAFICGSKCRNSVTSMPPCLRVTSDPCAQAPRGRIAILTGPTAVGKTEIALEVARALGTEIVSADSMQVYRRMEAGTAKPSPEQRAAVPHHLIDFVDPAEPFTVADYRAAAISAIDGLLGARKLPLVVGGTRLYLISLTAPFFTGPPPDPLLREQLAALSPAERHARLREIDPESASRLHPEDTKRIIRALEVYQTSGEPISAHQARSQEVGGRFEAVWVALVRDRAEIYERIDRRVDAMIEAGLIDEVERFIQEGRRESEISMQAHGYKEVIGYLLGRYDRDEAIRLLKRNTRHYAKYQLNWLRQIPGIQFVPADAPDAIDRIIGLLTP